MGLVYQYGTVHNISDKYSTQANSSISHGAIVV